jgi:hypothetical protein
MAADGSNNGTASAAGRQRVLLGHTAYVARIAIGGEGRLLASGQEGRQPVVRLWDMESGECLAILCGKWEPRVEQLLCKNDTVLCSTHWLPCSGKA